MKQKFHTLTKFFRDNFFVLFAAAALFLPDLQLRNMVIPKAFSDPYVNPVTWGFTLCWIFLILLICLFWLSKKWGRIVYIVITGSFIILSLCQYIYFKIFDQFFWIKSTALVGEGAEYLSFALNHIDLRLLSCTGLAILFLVIAALLWKKPAVASKKCRLIVLLPILGMIALHTAMLPQLHGDSADDWDSWRKPRIVYKQFNDVNKSFDVCGLYHFTFRDLYETLLAPNDYGKNDFETVDAYFAKKGEPQKNEYSGIFKGKNVIAVMLEGIDTWMIDEKYTPTLCKMMKNGINFTNYHSPFFGTGHTFNAEFAFNTGYFTPMSAVSAVNFSSNSFPYALPKLFKDTGYSVNSFHYNDSEFYNRGIMHKSFGYEKYHSFTEFGMPETVSQADSNLLKDDAIYKKITANQPFFSFIITYSGHVPYTFDDAKLALAKSNHPELVDPNMNVEKNNCLILAADTDDFFKQLLGRLEADNLLNDTVIVVYTDHYAYGFSDPKLLAEYKGDEIMYRVPAFIYAQGITAKKVAKPMMTIDWLPTLTNLFGLETDGRYIGNDIFDPKNPGFVYFGGSDWLDDKMYYNPAEQESAPTDKEHILSQNRRVRESLEINEIVISGDYYGHK